MIVWKIKTLYGYEVGGLPCTSGYRGITVYCYLKGNPILGIFQEKINIFGENTSKNLTISLLPAVGTNVWGYL